MKRISVITTALVLTASFALAQSGSISTAVEPALNAPARFGVSVAGAMDISENSAVSLRAGTGNTFLAGVGRNFVEFLPGASLTGDIQAGVTGRRGMVLYGAGVATDLGNGYSVTYGLHVNKIAGYRMYPSAYVSLGKTWGK